MIIIKRWEWRLRTKFKVGTSEVELQIIELTTGRGLRYNSKVRWAHSRIQIAAYFNGLLIIGSDGRCWSMWEGMKCLTRLYSRGAQFRTPLKSSKFHVIISIIIYQAKCVMRNKPNSKATMGQAKGSKNVSVLLKSNIKDSIKSGMTPIEYCKEHY